MTSGMRHEPHRVPRRRRDASPARHPGDGRDRDLHGGHDGTAGPVGAGGGGAGDIFDQTFNIISDNSRVGWAVRPPTGRPSTSPKCETLARFASNMMLSLQDWRIDLAKVRNTGNVGFKMRLSLQKRRGVYRGRTDVDAFGRGRSSKMAPTLQRDAQKLPRPLVPLMPNVRF